MKKHLHIDWYCKNLRGYPTTGISRHFKASSRRVNIPQGEKMVERYVLPPMDEIWSEEAKINRWMRVELAVIEAREELGEFPRGIAREIARVRVDPDEVKRREEVTRHEFLAFVECVVDKIGDKGSYFHRGLTSSDVLDTALSLALVESTNVILKDLEELLDVLWKLAIQYKKTPIIGRTHGVHAEPTTFGLKVLNWYSEMERNLQRLRVAKEEISYGKVSGAVGNYSMLDPKMEEIALEKLGLKVEKVSTQIVPRDRHAFFLSILAILGAGVERIATEIRNLHRTEIGEVFEPFFEGQKGSSAMPHKRNPVVCERLTGLARILRSNAIAAIENIPLWHERDISHSSVERFILPTSTSLVHYMLVTLRKILENLEVNAERMLENIWMTKGIVFSQAVLVKLMEKGISRNEAYEIVKEASFNVMKEGGDFKKEIIKRSFLEEDEVDELFDLRRYARHVDEIFGRFKRSP